MQLPIIVGATSSDLGLNLAATPDDAFAAFGPDEAAARRAYEGLGDLQAINNAIGADRSMVEPARFVARAMSAAGVPVYHYRFSYVLEAKRAESPLGAPHATDVPFAFDRLEAVHGAIVTSADLEMSSAMADYWANFARSGDPNGEGLPVWPVYSPDEDRLLDFGSDGVLAAEPDPWRERLDVTELAITRVSAAPAATSLDLPASYEGEIPGASDLIGWHVDLLPGGEYQRRTTYLGEDRPPPIDEIGRFEYEAETGRLTLRGPEQEIFLLSEEDGAELRVMGRGGEPFESNLDYRLTRLTQPALIEPRLEIGGMFRCREDLRRREGEPSQRVT